MHHEVLILIGSIIIVQSATSPNLILVHGMHPTRLHLIRLRPCELFHIFKEK